MFRVLALLLPLLLIATAGTVPPQSQLPDDDTVAMVRANYLWQFSNYNNWPAETKKGKFTVGIYGTTSVYNAMSEKYGAKPVGSQTMDVLNLVEVTGTQSLHILFVDKTKKAELAKIIKTLKDKSTLIVTNWEGAITTGAHINFKNIDGVMRYELDKKKMEEQKITPGTKILQWAI
ncbi:MAG: YfiR family protein [Flavobacteriales bacterium]